MPALFLVLFVSLQAALYSYAVTVAGAAAQDGARAASAFDSRTNPAAGRAAASTALAQSHGSLEHWTVVTGGGPGGAEVTVTGTALSVLPGIRLRVSRTATLPWERLS